MTHEHARGVLGVTEDATESEITRAYRRLMTTVHPDVCKGPEADRLARQATEARKVLSKIHQTQERTAPRPTEPASRPTNQRRRPQATHAQLGDFVILVVTGPRADTGGNVQWGTGRLPTEEAITRVVELIQGLNFTREERILGTKRLRTKEFWTYGILTGRWEIDTDEVVARPNPSQKTGEPLRVTDRYLAELVVSILRLAGGHLSEAEIIQRMRPILERYGLTRSEQSATLNRIENTDFWAAGTETGIWEIYRQEVVLTVEASATNNGAHADELWLTEDESKPKATHNENHDEADRPTNISSGWRGFWAGVAAYICLGAMLHVLEALVPGSVVDSYDETRTEILLVPMTCAALVLLGTRDYKWGNEKRRVRRTAAWTVIILSGIATCGG